MATVANPYDPNQEEEQPNQGGGGQVLSSSAGEESSGGGGSASTSGGSSASPQRTPLTGTPNIQQYLQANQGAGQRLAGGIQSNVQNQANQLGQNVNTSKSQLQSQSQPLQQNLEQGKQTIQSAFQNPQQLLEAYNASKTQQPNQPLNQDQQQNLQQYNQFQQLNSGGYNPAISQYGANVQQVGNELQSQLGNIQQQSNASKNETGRFGLLQKTVGQPNYNVGQQTLDSLFLQAQPGVAKQLQQNLGQIANQAGSQVSGLTSDSQARLAALQGLSAQNQQLIKNQFGNELGNIGQNIQQEYGQLAQAIPQQQETLKQAFTTNSFTPEQLSDLGFKPGDQTWGLTPQELMDAGHFGTPALAEGAAGYAQAASPEEYARYQALNQLAGGSSGNLLQGDKDILAGTSAAGGYKPFNFDIGTAQDQIKAKEQSYNKDALANLQSMNAEDSFRAGPVISRIYNHINEAMQNGTMTPQQANDYLQQSINSFSPTQDFYSGNGYTRYRDYINNRFTPFTNYYNSKYAPAAASRIGMSDPGDKAHQLPTDPNDKYIDWTKIKSPLGK